MLESLFRQPPTLVITFQRRTFVVNLVVEDLVHPAVPSRQVLLVDPHALDPTARLNRDVLEGPRIAGFVEQDRGIEPEQVGMRRMASVGTLPPLSDWVISLPRGVS